MYRIKSIEFECLVQVSIKRPEIAHEFNIDDRVEWISSGTTKQGTVISVVMPGESPPLLEESPEFIFKSNGFGGPRREVSYMIALDLIGRCRKRKLYWPCVSQLRKINGP